MEIKNDTSYLYFDIMGGAITDFHLTDSGINPLNFAYTRDQMPVNNQQGAPYKGHFLCCSRWGRASDREVAAGAPDHGGFSNMSWSVLPSAGYQLQTKAESPLEGLSIHKIIDMDPAEPVVRVTDTLTNLFGARRSLHLVQHPTLSFPFLDPATVVDCNASIGFNQAYGKEPVLPLSNWPFGQYKKEGETINLRNPEIAYNGLFSFLIERHRQTGWITAYSPAHQLLIGYLWKRSDYPWIHLWQHFESGRIKYRALEFGVAGFHDAFRNIPDYPVEFQGEDAYLYLDAGQSMSKEFLCFLQPLQLPCSGVDDVRWDGQDIVIRLKDQPAVVRIKTSLQKK